MRQDGMGEQLHKTRTGTGDNGIMRKVLRGTHGEGGEVLSGGHEGQAVEEEVLAIVAAEFREWGPYTLDRPPPMMSVEQAARIVRASLAA